MALMNMHANLLINLIILLKIHLSSQGHFCNDFNMFPPLVMHRAIGNRFCSPLGKLWPKKNKTKKKQGGTRTPTNEKEEEEVVEEEEEGRRR